jgi:hypothetical protein
MPRKKTVRVSSDTKKMIFAGSFIFLGIMAFFADKEN